MCLKSFFFPHSPIFLINPERIENLTCCLVHVWSWICVCTWWCDMSTAADLLFSALFTKPVTPEQPTPLAHSPRHLTLVPHISLIASDLCFSHWLPVLLFKSFLFFSFFFLTNQLENVNWGDWTQIHNRESLPLISKKHFHNLSWAIFNKFAANKNEVCYHKCSIPHQLVKLGDLFITRSALGILWKRAALVFFSKCSLVLAQRPPGWKGIEWLLQQLLLE